MSVCVYKCVCVSVCLRVCKYVCVVPWYASGFVPQAMCRGSHNPGIPAKPFKRP